MKQDGFLFEAALDHIPDSQFLSIVAATIMPRPDDDIGTRLRAVIPELPDDVSLDDPLKAIGLHVVSITGWHRARAMDALLDNGFQAYVAGKRDDGSLILRYRRLPPRMPCPGYGEVTCGAPTIGGARCQRCADLEEQDLYDQP